MTKGINRLIEDRELAERLGEAATHIKERAEQEKICSQWKEYILELCK
jgi:hypothetical protein